MMMHMAQSEISSCPDSVKRMMLRQDGSVKPVVQFEVDGGPDENPNHVETRFLLAEIALGGPSLNPMNRRKQVGASTRESGGSAKNTVERDNGCITQATAGMVFNVDALGDLHDKSTGKIDDSAVKRMWEHHVDRYKAAVDGAPALNGSTMSALSGATASASSCDDVQVVMSRRPFLVEYLTKTTSKKRRAEMKKLRPDLVKHIETVEAARRHMERSGPYDTTVRACDDPNCRHGCALAPVVSLWWPDGPRLMPYPPVYRDAARPGHYLNPEETLTKYAANKYSERDAAELPSVIALRTFEKETKDAPLEPFPDDRIDHTVRLICDSSVDRQKLVDHFAHLRYVRLRTLDGVRKAADTRERKKKEREAAAAAAAAARAQQSLMITFAAGGGSTVADAAAAATAQVRAAADAAAAQVAARVPDAAAARVPDAAAPADTDTAARVPDADANADADADAAADATPAVADDDEEMHDRARAATADDDNAASHHSSARDEDGAADAEMDAAASSDKPNKTSETYVCAIAVPGVCPAPPHTRIAASSSCHHDLIIISSVI